METSNECKACKDECLMDKYLSDLTFVNRVLESQKIPEKEMLKLRLENIESIRNCTCRNVTGTLKESFINYIINNI